MAEEYGLDFNASARAMADACWPGPLTLVLPGGEGRLPPELRGAEGGIAVRHTSQREVALMISLMGHALTSTSANRPGQPTAPGTDGIVATFGEAEASGELLVLDGGVLGNVPPSTLVDCTAPLPRIIRDGAIPRAELRRMVREAGSVNVLFVCTGNTCRSPLAEALLRRLLEERRSRASPSHRRVRERGRARRRRRGATSWHWRMGWTCRRTAPSRSRPSSRHLPT